MINKYLVVSLLMLVTSIEMVQCKKSEPSKKQNKNNIDYNAFQAAVRDQDIDKVAIFLKDGANVNYQDEYQYTMLHYAVKSGNVEMVRLFINAGADLEIISHLGMSPLVYAITCISKQGHWNEYNENYIEIVKILIHTGSKTIFNDGGLVLELVDILIENTLEIQNILLENPDQISDEIDSAVFECEGGLILAQPYISSVDYKKIELDLLQVRMLLQSN